MSSKIGQPDRIDKDYSSKLASSGFCDMQRVNISGHSDAEIDLVSELGGNVIIRKIINDSGSDGSIYIKTVENDSDGYIAYPMFAGEKDTILVPISHVKKSGSITSAIFCYQKINQ